MDRHDLTEDVNADHVAKIHQEDLKVEQKFGCKGLTYWFDNKRKTAFCLIDAPNKKALEEMHNHAHGGIPNSIIEVDPSIVESFLGRIEDPVKAQNTDLNIVNDPAYRILMVTGFENIALIKSNSIPNKKPLQQYNESIIKQIIHFNGRLVKKKSDCLLVSFKSNSDAILCAIEVQSKFKEFLSKDDYPGLKLKIGLSSGIPVTEKEELFEDTIKLAERLCNVVLGQIVVSSEVKELYESENLNIVINGELVRTLNRSDEKFLNILMDFTEKTWNSTNLKVDDFSNNLGLSKSQLYRKIKSITGKSLNSFIKEYRMDKALVLLNNQKGNISEIAFETGFNSPAYFSKCFFDKYRILPSKYIQQHIN